jgi:hypothetical protein
MESRRLVAVNRKIPSGSHDTIQARNSRSCLRKAMSSVRRNKTASGNLFR